MGSRFPNGAVGAAYLLMRLQVVMAVLRPAIAEDPAFSWPQTIVGLTIVSLGFGLLTRIVAVGGGILLLADFVLREPSFTVAGQATVMFAIALQGAGAYSIDNLLFGRREIRFRP